MNTTVSGLHLHTHTHRTAAHHTGIPCHRFRSPFFVLNFHIYHICLVGIILSDDHTFVNTFITKIIKPAADASAPAAGLLYL